MHSQQFETNVEESLIGCPFGEKLIFFMNFKVLVIVILVNFRPECSLKTNAARNNLLFQPHSSIFCSIKAVGMNNGHLFRLIKIKFSFNQNDSTVLMLT